MSIIWTSSSDFWRASMRSSSCGRQRAVGLIMTTSSHRGRVRGFLSRASAQLYKAGESAGFIGSVVGDHRSRDLRFIAGSDERFDLRRNPNQRAAGSWGKRPGHPFIPNRMTGTAPSNASSAALHGENEAVPSHPANARGVRPVCDDRGHGRRLGLSAPRAFSFIRFEWS